MKMIMYKALHKELEQPTAKPSYRKKQKAWETHTE
jgi:hypothetical protein